MNKSRFDEIVKNRAQERVAAKVIKFRETIVAAVRELDPSTYQSFSDKNGPGWWPSKTKEATLSLILGNIALGLHFKDEKNAAGEYVRLTWPRTLWQREEDAVTKELLATMDEMARALCAPKAESADIQPEAEPVPAPANPA